MENTKWVLKERPIGLVKDSDFKLIKEEIGELNDQEILLENLYLSFDPTQRMWLNDMPGYLPPVQIGEVVRSGGVGKVIGSKHSDYKVGDLFSDLLDGNLIAWLHQLKMKDLELFRTFFHYPQC